MSFRAIQHGSRVLVLVNGKLCADLDSSTALETGRALMGVGRLAQEFENAEKVIDDSALFLRCTGLGLASNPRMIDEAHRRAQWDRQYRSVPAIDGIPSAARVGRPLVSKGRKA